MAGSHLGIVILRLICRQLATLLREGRKRRGGRPLEGIALRPKKIKGRLRASNWTCSAPQVPRPLNPIKRGCAQYAAATPPAVKTWAVFPPFSTRPFTAGPLRAASLYGGWSGVNDASLPLQRLWCRHRAVISSCKRKRFRAKSSTIFVRLSLSGDGSRSDAGTRAEQKATGDSADHRKSRGGLSVVAFVARPRAVSSPGPRSSNSLRSLPLEW